MPAQRCGERGRRRWRVSDAVAGEVAGGSWGFERKLPLRAGASPSRANVCTHPEIGVSWLSVARTTVSDMARQPLLDPIPTPPFGSSASFGSTARPITRSPGAARVAMRARSSEGAVRRQKKRAPDRRRATPNACSPRGNALATVLRLERRPATASRIVALPLVCARARRDPSV